MTNLFGTAHLDAYFDQGQRVPQHAEITLRLRSETEAQELVARFPKFVKITMGRVGGHPDGDYYRIHLHVALLADGVNGGVNETGLKRILRAEKVLADNGYEPEFGTTRWHGKAAENLYLDRAEFDTAIKA